MTEQNKFKPVDSLPIYDDGIGKVSLYDASYANESEEQRIWTVTTLASLAYGNDEAKNPEALYKRLQELKHESLWEFIRDGIEWHSISYSMRGDIDSYAIKSGHQTNADEHKKNIACFRIKVPLFVARQFMRHRSFSYLEMSRRYTKDSKVPFEFWFPKDFDSAMLDNGGDDYASSLVTTWMNDYERAVNSGYHTQVASRFLPQTTYTEFYMMGEVEGLKNFFGLRLKPSAQDEIRELSMAMLKLIAKHQPELYEKVLP